MSPLFSTLYFCPQDHRFSLYIWNSHSNVPKLMTNKSNTWKIRVYKEFLLPSRNPNPIQKIFQRTLTISWGGFTTTPSTTPHLLFNPYITNLNKTQLEAEISVIFSFKIWVIISNICSSIIITFYVPFLLAFKFFELIIIIVIIIIIIIIKFEKLVLLSFNIYIYFFWEWFNTLLAV